MDQTTKYIEALDTLIRFYQGKIAELEAMKLDVISEGTEEKSECERKVVHETEYYDILSGHVTKRIIFDDGMFADIDMGEPKR